MKRAIIGCLMASASGAFACDYPDEGGMPLRRAVTRVQTLADVEAWAEAMRRNKVNVQYLVRLDAPVHGEGRGAASCYWPVEVRADGKLWRRYLVSPDGKSVRHD